jgi:type 1 glutamine amidotransferase
MNLKFLKLAACFALVAVSTAVGKPLKGLIITGGCCHDYKNQKNIVSEGISKRVPVKWEVYFEMNQQKSKEHLSEKGWADDCDFIVWNHCFAHEKDAKFIDSLAAIHKAGKPAIALHCAMHSYHWSVKPEKGKENTWPQFLGVYSKGHGPKRKITVSKAKGQEKHPILKDMPEGWTTPDGELYNVQRVLTATVLAYGSNGVAKEPQACIWVNEYGKARIFGTTIGHHNSTMSTKEYLDLLGNAVRWVTQTE